MAYSQENWNEAAKYFGTDYGRLSEWEKNFGGLEATPAVAEATNNLTGAGNYNSGGYTGGAASENLAAAPKNQELAALINTVNASAQTKLNEARLGSAGVTAQNQMLENINRSAQGYLGEDYVRQQQNKYAGEAGNSGMGVDSSNWNAALERTLGLETKKVQDDSINQYATLLANNPAAKLYGMESGNISPADYASAQNQRYATNLKQQEFAQSLALDYAKLAESNRASVAALEEQNRASEAALAEQIRQANLTKTTTQTGPESSRTVVSGSAAPESTWGSDKENRDWDNLRHWPISS